MAGCDRTSLPEFQINAPAFDTSRVKFTRYSYPAVGDFAGTHGSLIPYIDANADGRFDPLVEPSGRCDQHAGQCWLDHARIRMIQRATGCPSTAGIWLLGDVYDRAGQRQESMLCDDEGKCAEEHPDAFKDIASVKAIWIAEQRSSRPARTLTLSTTNEELRFDNLVLPLPLELVDLKTELPADLDVRATASQSIDMAVVWVMHDREQWWSSVDHPTSLKVADNVLEAHVPELVMKSCQGACDVFLQFAHVWRDDAVLSLGEIKQRLR